MNNASETGDSRKQLDEHPTLKQYTEDTVTVDHRTRLPGIETMPDEVVAIKDVKPTVVGPSPTSETRNAMANKYSSMDPQPGP